MGLARRPSGPRWSNEMEAQTRIFRVAICGFTDLDRLVLERIF
jgi:hypothetical protein